MKLIGKHVVGLAVILAIGSAMASTVTRAQSLKTAGAEDPTTAVQAKKLLSQCLLASVDAEDRRVLVNWIFMVIARHPDIRSMVRMDNETENGIILKISSLFERLVAEQCVGEVRHVARYSGFNGIAESFEVLGESAVQALLENPEVISGFGSTLKYVDLERINRAMFDERMP